MKVIGMEASHGDAVLTFACAATEDHTGKYNAILGWKVAEDRWKEYVEDGSVSVIAPSPEIEGGPCDQKYMVMRVRTDSVPGALLHVALADCKRTVWQDGPWTYWLFHSLEDLHELTGHLGKPLLAWSKLVGSKEARSAAFVLDHKLVGPEILGLKE